MVEHHNGIVGVRGSNPLGSTISEAKKPGERSPGFFVPTPSHDAGAVIPGRSVARNRHAGPLTAAWNVAAGMMPEMLFFQFTGDLSLREGIPVLDTTRLALDVGLR